MTDKDFAQALAKRFIDEISDGWGEETEQRDVARLVELVVELAAKVRADEREKCAQVCESLEGSYTSAEVADGAECAVAIRARKE